MSLKKIHNEQPKDFKFSDGNLKKAEEKTSKGGLYPLD